MNFRKVSILSLFSEKIAQCVTLVFKISSGGRRTTSPLKKFFVFLSIVAEHAIV